MKLYVWSPALTDYTDGIMFALAESVEEARELLLKECSYIPREDLNEEPVVYDNEKTAYVVWGGG